MFLNRDFIEAKIEKLMAKHPVFTLHNDDFHRRKLSLSIWKVSDILICLVSLPWKYSFWTPQTIPSPCSRTTRTSILRFQILKFKSIWKFMASSKRMNLKKNDVSTDLWKNLLYLSFSALYSLRIISLSNIFQSLEIPLSNAPYPRLYLWCCLSLLT